DVLQLLAFPAPASPEIYTLSLHDALPIWCSALRLALAESDAIAAGAGWCTSTVHRAVWGSRVPRNARTLHDAAQPSHRSGRTAQDRKSTRLNSSHVKNSYAGFCLNKQNY